MARTYGGRWTILRDLGRGGQGDVFEVEDLTRPSAETFALKRVRNPNRRQRFENEVAAIKMLDHANIVRLIDHSALDASGDDSDKHFIVMPLARHGDLEARAAVYRGSLDGTVAVARQLASALASAHEAGVIHRDVKPANVLFPDVGNTPWLSDFGICLIRNAERATETGEVAGPRAFMAPELEEGGQLDVTAAADVYSLGKLIYYMVSGGVVMAREALFQPQHASVFSAGGRWHLLELLLRRMVCQIGERLQTMREVEREMQRILDWDLNSVAPPFSPGGRSRIEALQQGASRDRQAAAEEQASRDAMNKRVEAATVQLSRWLEGELRKAAAMLGEGGAIGAEVAEVPPDELQHTEVNDYLALRGVELIVHGLSERYLHDHALQLLVCRQMRFVVSVTIGTAANPARAVEEPALAILPRYVRVGGSGAGRTRRTVSRYCLAQPARLVPIPMKAPGRAPQQLRKDQVICMELPALKWPEAEEELRIFMTTVSDGFVEVLMRNRDQPFPT